LGVIIATPMLVVVEVITAHVYVAGYLGRPAAPA